MRKRKQTIPSISIKGFGRVQIVDKKTRKIVGDSGWGQNQITNYGLESCLVAAPIGAGSVQAAGIILGSSNGDPASDTASLPGSHTDFYSAFAQSTVSDSLTARMTVTFDTPSATTIGCMGLLAATSGTLLAGKSFTGGSSAVSTDQDINCTYEFRYTTS